jgi:two-component system, NarL family, nitrate/nitrite response regulator NarL
MKIIILTPIRILGGGLEACFSRCPEFTLLATVRDLPSLRAALREACADLVLIDVTQGIDLEEVRTIAEEWTDVALMALGLCVQRPEVIRCGRAGFVGYVSREATVDALCQAMREVVTGRLHCSADISGALLRALFHMNGTDCGTALESSATLTRREGEVLQLIGRGLSNKEIARELRLSTATIKHHVHGVLGKLQVARRVQAMRRVREAPWLVSSALPARHED